MTKKNESGFTLIEILIAVIVLSIALTPMIVGLTGALEQNTNIEKKTRTAFLAQKRLEKIKVRSIANFDVNYSGSGSMYDPVADPHDPGDPNDVDFRYRVTYPDGFVSTDSIRLIQVEVWYDQNKNGNYDAGEDRTILYTKAAKRGEPG